MRLADYVMKFLEETGVKNIFMLSGGGMMYLMDALGRSKIEYVCCHHEQAAGISAVGYSLESNNLGVCMLTTGPGGTNALTALGAAYVDSTPVLFISGQVKTADFASLRKVRQFGAQENDIVSMAKPVSKYAVTVINKEDIRYHLEKALYFALHGRRGPVWIDIPLDIQNAEIDPDCLKPFIPEMEDHSNGNIDCSIKDVVTSIRESRRPLFLVGHGLRASGMEKEFLKIVEELRIPVQTTWRELALFDDEDELFFGSPGLQARRYSNIILQGADLLIVLGSRLDNMITAFSEEHFGCRARKYVVDIDENEITKLKMTDMHGICCDLKAFVPVLHKEAEGIKCDWSEWINICNVIKNKYPLKNEEQDEECFGVDLYNLAKNISEHSTSDDTLVISSTSRCNTAGHIAFSHRSGQRLISSMGFGSMGFALPHVVGVWFASPVNIEKRRILMLEGDGSLQLNLQELQTIVHHKINAKMFIFSNTGYAAIATMQNRNFDGFHVGSDQDSGVTMPDLGKIAEAYGIPYYLIKDESDREEIVKMVMNSAGPAICEFRGSILFDEIPKCISSLDENGNRVSAALENPYPFIDSKELDDIFLDIENV